jgi:hypothetical protein
MPVENQTVRIDSYTRPTVPGELFQFVLQLIDAVEALAIDPVDAAPDCRSGRDAT